MNVFLRYISLGAIFLLLVHYLATLTWHSYSTATSSRLSSLSETFTLSTRPVNATVFVLCRESDLNDILSSLQTFESTYNSKPSNRYPYVFLNDDRFSPHFQQTIRASISSSVEFGQIDPEDWKIPSHINMTRASKYWKDPSNIQVPYAASQPYRQMCRYQSGLFFHHPLLTKYKYYWRLEPGVKFFCDLESMDPFRYMQVNKLKYGFVLTVKEIPRTVASLWVRVRQWFQQNPHFLHSNNLFEFVSENDGISYNHCHFWSNFEIADMDFYRSEAYTSFFQHLDTMGGFFYERWGDAPVHSIAASLLLDRNEIHFFDNIGYHHNPILHCPKESALGKKRCFCSAEYSFDFDPGNNSCLAHWHNVHGRNATKIKQDWYTFDA